MSRSRRHPRLSIVPPEHRAYLADVVRRRGVPGATRVLGIGRTALLGVLATGECMPGTAALIREAVQRRDAA